MTIILHITEREQWKKAKLSGVYRDDTLDSDDSYIVLAHNKWLKWQMLSSKLKKAWSSFASRLTRFNLKFDTKVLKEEKRILTSMDL